MKMTSNNKKILLAVFTTLFLMGCNKATETAKQPQTEGNASTNTSANDDAVVEIKTKTDLEKLEKQKATEQKARPVQTFSVSSQSQTVQHSFNGLVKAGKESNLSFRVAGNVNNLTIKVGDYLKKGDFIAQLDDTDYHVSASQSIASLNNAAASKQAVFANIKQAEAEMMRARSAYARAEKLYETDSISVGEFEQARAAWQSSEASVEATKLQFASAEAQEVAAQQQLRASENQLAYTKLTAPFSGVITQVNADENEQIQAGQSVAVLTDVSTTEIEVGVPASVIASVKNGDVAKISFFGNANKSFKGTVTEVGYSTANSSVFPVVLRLSGADRSIRPGMAANVTFKHSGSTVSSIVVPTTAIGEDKGGKYVYLVKQTSSKESKNPAYKVIRQAVVLGDMSSKGFEVLYGLQNGDVIAKAGLNVLQNNDSVTPFTPK